MKKRPAVAGVRLLLSPAIIAGISVVCYRVFGVNATTAGFAYLIGILVIAAVGDLWEALLASTAAMLCFVFFFLPPIGRFAIAGPENWAALFAFVVTAFVASHLSDRARKQTGEAKNRQLETERLYSLSRSILLGEATGLEIAQNLALTFDCKAVALYDAGTGEVFRAGPEDQPQIEMRLKEVVNKGGLPGFISNPTLAVLSTGGRKLGALALKEISLTPDALQALLNLVAIALEKVQTQDAANRAEAARHSEEFKSTLLDAIAHEFKTPLTSIKAASTSILADVPDLAPHVRELISIIDEEANRLDLLVTDARRMAQMEASKIQLERQAVMVKQFVVHVLEAFGTRLQGRTLHLKLDDQLPRMSADPDMASMALRQVIDNGLKYSPAATPLEVSAEADTERVTIRVRDHGPGIPEAERDRVFDRFYRRGLSKDRVPGSGLGLYIAREIMRAHGGDMWVESAAGPGSAFCLALPTQKAQS